MTTIQTVFLRAYWMARGLLALLVATALLYLHRIHSCLASARSRKCVAPSAGHPVVEPRWLETVLWTSGFYTAENYRAVHSVQATVPADNRGMCAHILLVRVHYTAGSAPPLSLPPEQRLPDRLMLKYSAANWWGRTATLFAGSYREGLFYAATDHPPELAPLLPRVLYASGSALCGEYVVLMEDACTSARGTTCGANLVFGNQSWGLSPEAVRTLNKTLDGSTTALEVLARAFRAAARMHAATWNSAALLGEQRYGWLKGRRWLSDGGDRLRWESAMEVGRRSWEAFRDDRSRFRLSAALRTLIDRSFAASTFAGHLRQLRRRPFALCHGDFHAANMLVGRSSELLVLVDWSEVGVQLPVADIAQMVVSDLHHTQFGRVRDVFRHDYYECLCQSGRVDPNIYTEQQCWDHFVRAGLEKWVWFFAIIVGTPQMPKLAVQYFHDQLCQFHAHFGQSIEQVQLSSCVPLLDSFVSTKEHVES